jgi:excisionase family DNA binding protein
MMNKAEIEPLLTIKQVAATLGASEKTVRRRIESGELPVMQDGRLLRVRQVDLRAFIAARISA